MYSELASDIHDITNNYILVKKQPNWTGDVSVMIAQAAATISKAEADKAEARIAETSKVEVGKAEQVKLRFPKVKNSNLHLQRIFVREKSATLI